MSKIEAGEIYTLDDENGDEQEVEVLGVLKVEGAEYAVVAFVEDIKDENEEEDMDIFFLKAEEDGSLSEIENDDEFDKVTQAFEEMMAAEGEE
jgi:uncharacterized protein YrzB (UPF0473 family)